MAQEPKRAPHLLSHQEDRLWKWVGRYVQPRVDRRKRGRIWEQSYNPIVLMKVENRRAPARGGHGTHWREGGSRRTNLLKGNITSVVLGNSGTSFPVTFADVEISQSAVSPGDSTVVCRVRSARRTYSEPLMTRSGASSEMRDLRGAPLVSVMQPAQHWDRYDPARLWRLDRTGLRSIFLQCQVNAVLMVIIHECLEVPVQTSLVEHDQVIQALAADCADDPLDVSTLPRGTRRRQHLFDAHRPHLLHELLAKDPIAIAQQVARRGVPRKGFSHLLRRPFRRGMCGDCKVQDAPPLVRQHQKYVSDLEPNRGHDKEIHRHHRFQVIVQECPPGL